jgi:hypothetical protein
VHVRSKSEDEGGRRRLPGAIRARDVRAADLQEEPTRPVKNRAVFVRSRFVGSDEDGGLPGEHRSERSEPFRHRERSERSNQN